MENGVIPCNSNSNLDIEDTKARADVNGVLKMVKQKKKLNAKMRDLKQKMNTKWQNAKETEAVTTPVSTYWETQQAKLEESH